MASSKLIGTAPDQAPSNADLGTLAFQDSNAVKITGGDVTANHYVDTAISEVKPSLLLDFANGKTLDPRITFTRSTTATYYDGKTTAMAEQNLASYSQQLNNTNWSVAQANWIQNVTTAPDGTPTASLLYESSSTSEHYTAKSIGPSGVTAIFTTSVYAKTCGRQWLILNNNQSTGSTECWFDLVNGTVGTVGSGMTATITSVGNGWYRCVAWGSVSSGWQPGVQLYLASTNGAATYAGDGASGVYCWGIQYEQRSGASAYVPTTSSPVTNYIPALQTAGGGAPRFDHDPITGESKGLLIEEQRTNIHLYSSAFDGTTYYVEAGSYRNNAAVAPDGTLSASAVVEGSTFYCRARTQATVVSGTTYTYSAYLKRGQKTQAQMQIYSTFTNVDTLFDLVSGTIVSGSGTITSVGNGWFRCSVTAAVTGTTALAFSYPATVNGYSYTHTTGVDGIYIWGAQLEAGAFSTSYIPTTSAQVTRSAENAQITGANFTSWYNPYAGTLYAEQVVGNINDSLANQGGAVLYKDNGNFIALGQGTGAATAGGRGGEKSAVWINVNNANSFYAITPIYLTIGSTAKCAVGYGAANFAFSANNGSLVTSTSATQPIPYDVNKLIIGNAYSGYYSNGCIKRIAYYPARLSNAELQEMTS